MQFNDNIQHYKPHVHVQYAEHRAAIGIDSDVDTAPEYLFVNGMEGTKWP